jgi:hypothetical protein
MNEIQTKLDEMINGAISGSVQLQQANVVGRLVREKTRLYALRHKSAESQNKLEQLNVFYGLK